MGCAGLLPEVLYEAAAAPRSPPRSGRRDIVLDCELVTLDELARPNLAALVCKRWLQGMAAERAAARAPAVLLAFDVQWWTAWMCAAAAGQLGDVLSHVKRALPRLLGEAEVLRRP